MDAGSGEDEFVVGDSKIQGTDELMSVVHIPTDGTMDTDRASAEIPEDENGSDADTQVNSEYGDSDDDESVMSRQQTHRGLNGRRPIDHTPPDQLLQKTEKRATRHIKQNESDLALREFIRCTVLARLVYGDQHWRLARAHTKLASAYLDLKGYSAQAIYHSEITENIMRNHLASDDYTTEKPLIYMVLVEMYFTLGRALTVEKKLTEAEAALSKSEKLLQDVEPLVTHESGDDIEDWTVRISLAMGRLHFRQEKSALSITYFERALDLMQKKYGHDSPQLISVYQSLGSVEQGKGRQADHLRAIEHFLQAHSIASSKFNECDVEVAETGYALALAYTNVGDDDAENSAESYFNQSLATYEDLYGADYEKTLEIKDELARLMIRTDRVEEAITLLQTTMKPKQDRYGDLSPQVAETWKIIGNCHLSLGSTEKALNALKKCKDIESTVHGVNSRKAKDTQKTIDLLLSNPNLAAKQKKSKADQLKQRPPFSSVAKTATILGGFKPQT